MKLFILLLFTFLSVASESSRTSENSYDEIVVTPKTYLEIKQEILLEKNKIQKNSISSDSLVKVFTTNLVDKIIPHWYETNWTFDGHTSIPRNGSIACGYFVSTTLKDMGFTINKYKLAQQLPINEAYSLVIDQKVLKIDFSSNLVCQKQLYKQLEGGIYFIGFDKNHVGYIYKTKNQLFIIDSNYLSGKVQIEKIEDSKVFASFNTFYITPLSTNKTLLKHWLDNKEIKIITTHN